MSDARDALIRLHLPQAKALASNVAASAPSRWADRDELLQLACLTLVECSHAADPGEPFAGRVLSHIEDVLLNALALLDIEESVRNALSWTAGCEELESIRDLVRALPERESAVIEQHYFRGDPFKTIAGEMRLTQGRISQIHKQGITRLRELMTAARI